MADASFAVAQEPPWSPWRDTALVLVRRGASARRRRRPGRVLFAESSALAAAHVQHRLRSSSASPSSRCWRWIAGDWAEAAEHVERALAAIDEHRMHDYAISLLAFAAAARLAVHRGDLNEADRQLTRAMRARPSCTFVLPFLAVRAAAAAGQGVLRPSATDRPPATCCGRSTTSCSHRPASRRPRRRGRRRSAGSSPRAHAAGAAGAAPLSPAELRLLPYLQTHLTIREIGERLFVSRNTVNSEVGSIYRKLGVSSRSDAVQQATAVGLLGG